ncbi:hypothetical protein [Kangiella marina]|uniref:Uncharacterized protein n=1 Tax=Kangiella marina TaxID=1079178 RepID=A0ABP8IN31_9GAMM
MGNRKDKPIRMRVLSSVASLMLLGSIVFVLIAGFNLYVTSMMAAGFLGLAAPSVASGEGFFEILAGFFEDLIDGIIEIISGIFEAITSIFG